MTSTTRFGDYDITTLYLTGGWEWSVVGVAVTEDGYYIGTDSGCSCFSPWENYSPGLDDLTGPLTIDEMKEEVTSLAKMYRVSIEALEDFFDEF